MVLNYLRNCVCANKLFKNGNPKDAPESNDSKKKNESKVLFQILNSIGPLLLTAGVGAMMGFSGIFLPQLKEENSRIKNVDLGVESWIAASAVLPLTVCSLVGGFFMEKIGRKWAHIVAAIPGMIGWIIIYFAQDVTTVLIGRVLTGICCGIVGPVSPIYIGETTSPSLRPFILGGIALNLTVGTLLCHLVGTFYTWETTALFCLIFPTLGGFLTFFSQESPTWFFRKNNIDSGCKTFKKLRGESEESMKELNVIMDKHAENRKNSSEKVAILTTLSTHVVRPEIYKPFLIVCLYFISAQFAGINIITFYAIGIVQHSLGSNIKNEYLIMLSMDSIRAATSILACILLKKLPRRHIAIIGGSGCTICLLALSVSNYMLDIFEDTQVLEYISLVALLGYVFFISISLVPLPWCLAGELLPQDIKEIAGGALCFITFSGFFTAIKCAPFLFSGLGMASSYLIFCCSALFGTCLCYIFLPETKNKTLSDIAAIYKKGVVIDAASA